MHSLQAVLTDRTRITVALIKRNHRSTLRPSRSHPPEYEIYLWKQNELKRTTINWLNIAVKWWKLCDIVTPQLSVWFTVCLIYCIFVYLIYCSSVCLAVCLLYCLSICLIYCLPTCLIYCLSKCPPELVSVYSSVRFTVCLTVCASILSQAGS